MQHFKVHSKYKHISCFSVDCIASWQIQMQKYFSER